MPHDDEVHAIISTGRQRLRLQVGDAVTVGRASGNAMRIGHAPVDLRVPREAMRLECRADGVLIFNTSDKRTITADVFPGPGFDVPPLSLAGTAPHRTVALVIHGTDGVRHTVTVDSTRLTGAARAQRTTDAATDRGDITLGYERLSWVSDRQRQLLCALVLPGRFGWHGSTGTPTYAQMAEILDERGVRLTPKHIRNTLDEMRLRIALDHDVYDIHGDGPASSPQPPPSYLPGFAQWVLLSGNVTDDELDAFDSLAG